MKRNWIRIGIIVLVIAAIALFVYPHLTASAASTANIQTVAVQRGNIVATVSAAGNVSAPEDANVAFQTTGQIAKVNVQVGDPVKKGQVLMQLNTTNLKLALQSAQASEASAQANYDATKAKAATNEDQLVVAKAALDNAQAALQQAQAAYDKVASAPNIGMLSQSLNLQQATNNYNSALATYKETAATINNDALKQAQAQLNQAQIAVEQAQQNLDEATIVAPFNGYVAAVNYSVGDMAGSGAAVEVVNLSTLEVNATVSEIDVVKVQAGQTAQMTLDALPNKTYTATVTQVGPSGTITQGVVNYPVTFRVDNTTGEIKPGMTASLNIDVAQANNVLYVPTRAVRTVGNRETVTVLYKGQEIAVPIQTGLSNYQNVQVTQGLKQGDLVVLNQTQTTSPRVGGGGGGGFFRLGG